MSNLSAFLHPAALNEEKEIVISERFTDENGTVVPFKIRALSQEEVDSITAKSRRREKVGGKVQEKLDSIVFARRMVVAATVEPDFSSKELCEAYGVMDPLLVPVKMLKSGEYSKLMDAITELSGFDDNEGIDEEAKN